MKRYFKLPGRTIYTNRCSQETVGQALKGLCHPELVWLLLPKSSDFVQNVWFPTGSKIIKRTAFSLVEMLMALLVASLVLAALAPVVTRKMNDNIRVTGVDSVIYDEGKTIYSTPGEYTFVVPQGVYELEIQASGGGGGGGGASDTMFTKVYTMKASIPVSDVTDFKTLTLPVQKGYYSLDAVLIGAGGTGGYGYGKISASGENALCETDPDSPSDSYRNFRRIPNAADSGRDLCYVPTYLTSENINNVSYSTYIKIVDSQTESFYTGTCWVGKTSSGTTISGSYDATKRPICTYNAACDFNMLHNVNSKLIKRNIRKLTVSEMRRIIDMSIIEDFSKNYLGKNYLDLTGYVYGTPYFSTSGDQSGCHGQGYCKPSYVLLSDGAFQLVFKDGTVKKENIQRPYLKNMTQNSTGLPICAYEVMDWFPHTGAGGPAGTKNSGTIKLSKTGTNPYLSLQMMPIIEPQQIGEDRNWHNWTSTRLEYYNSGNKLALLGAGAANFGFNASESENGKEVIQASNNLGGGGGKNLSNLVNGFATGANDAQNSLAKGAAGTDERGGTGAGGALGGKTGADTVEEAKGEDATKPGYGGGGGACYYKARQGIECSAGGKGGPAQTTLKFKAGAAGSGGGAGGTVGGNKHVKIKDVKPGDIVSIKVGNGGAGGGVGASGANGEDTVITLKVNNREKTLVFKGGKGGSAGAFEKVPIPEIDSDISIENSNIESGYLLAAKTTEGGAGGAYPDISKNGTDDIYTSLVNPLTSASTELEKRGGKGSNDNGGYAGGEGGSTASGSRGGCGGFEVSEADDDGYKYCNLTTANGADARSYNPVKNQNGGAGGGGGGVDYENGILGTGGAGAGGYVVIKWAI